MNFKIITKLTFAVCAMLSMHAAFCAASSSSAAASSSSAQQAICSICRKTNDEPKRCSRCQQKVYCSRDCQIKDWPTHKKHCKPITTTRKAITLTPMQKELVNAAQKGNISQLKKLINKDNASFCHPALGPILTLAVASQKTKAVKFLLNQSGINIDQRNPLDNSTALFNVCQLGYTGIVKLLLSKGANPNIQILDGATPLFIAAQEGHTEIVQILLEHKSCKKYLNKPMHDGSTPLYAAVRHNKPKIVEQLLNANADTTAKTTMGQTALFVAVGLGYSNIINIILEHDVSSIDQPNSEGATPLMFACQIGHKEAVKSLLAKKADLKITKHDGTTALHVACLQNHSEIIQLLLDHSADPCAVDELGKTPLMTACTHGRVESAQLLLKDQRVDPNHLIQSEKLAIHFWVTPLIAACSMEHKEVVELLLSQRSVDPNIAIASTGKTPLTIAIELGNVEIVQLLLQNGADPTQADTILRTPLAFAQAYKEEARAKTKPVFDRIIKLLNQYIPLYLEKRTCIECKKTFKKRLKKCSICRKARYCSRECQTSD